MLENNAGSYTLALSSTTGAANWLVQADIVVSIIVGVLSAVGIIYSIIWHRCRIKTARKKSDDKQS